MSFTLQKKHNGPFGQPNISPFLCRSPYFFWLAVPVPPRLSCFTASGQNPHRVVNRKPPQVVWCPACGHVALLSALFFSLSRSKWTSWLTSYSAALMRKISLNSIFLTYIRFYLFTKWLWPQSSLIYLKEILEVKIKYKGIHPWAPLQCKWFSGRDTGLRGNLSLEQISQNFWATLASYIICLSVSSTYVAQKR